LKWFKKSVLSILMDTLIILGSAIVASFLFNDSSAILTETAYLFFTFWSTFMIGFYLFHLYSRSWKFAGTDEFKRILKGAFLSMMIIGFIQLILNAVQVMTLSVQMILLTWLIIVTGLYSLRLVLGAIQDNRGELNEKGKRTLIVGAGKAGLLVLKELRKNVNSPLYPIAFIDDDLEKQHFSFYGVIVAGTRKEMVHVIKQYKIETVVIAIPSAPGSEITKIMNICKDHNIEVKILPRIIDIVNGRISLNMIRKVEVEDLLGRPPIKLDLLGISNYVKDRTVLITGAGGSIGSEICRQLSDFEPKKLLLLGHGENSIYTIENELKRKFPHLLFETIIADIQDRKRIEEIFLFHRPNVVFHAAAHKHVPLMEANPIEAIKNNVFGTKNVAECAHKYHAEKFVQISTDKAVNPTSVMGATKRIAELVIQHLSQQSNTHFVAVRFGNVLGSRGSVIPLFKKQIKEGGPVTVTHPDMTRYFMTIPEAVQLVLQAGALAEGGEIFILDMGKPVKISELAKNLIRLSGLTPDEDIQIIYTGIRPGEKLYEELFTSEEGNSGSTHQLIFIAKPTDFSEMDLPSLLGELESAVYTEKNSITVKEIKYLIKQIVSTY
jgi:FlaA1/EpsC-like NDP-sugar epimerase